MVLEVLQEIQFFLLQGNIIVRLCRTCIGELSLEPAARSPRCSGCCATILYADDLNAIHRSSKKERKTVEEKVEQEGSKLERMLRKLGLCMNKTKLNYWRVQLIKEERQALEIIRTGILKNESCGGRRDRGRVGMSENSWSIF